MTRELERTIVHSDEAGSQECNPDTHEVSLELIPGGNLIVHVRPKGDVVPGATIVLPPV